MADARSREACAAIVSYRAASGSGDGQPITESTTSSTNSATATSLKRTAFGWWGHSWFAAQNRNAAASAALFASSGQRAPGAQRGMREAGDADQRQGNRRQEIDRARSGKEPGMASQASRGTSVNRVRRASAGPTATARREREDIAWSLYHGAPRRERAWLGEEGVSAGIAGEKSAAPGPRGGRGLRRRAECQCRTRATFRSLKSQRK